MKLPFIIIDDCAGAQSLAARLQSLSAEQSIAVDTEFIRVTEYYPKLALLQIKLEDDIFLVDPLKAPLDVLLPALLRTQALFLVCSGDEDLQILVQIARRFNQDASAPVHYCDLQVMEAFSGHAFGRGLAAMVKEWCSCELAKEETLSDWLQRPLSPEQLRYAALDVEFLPDLYQQLKAALNSTQLQWFLQEMQEKSAALLTPSAPAMAYRSVGGAGILSCSALNLLQQLCERRQLLGQAQDEALNRIITGKALCEIARTRPHSTQQLAACGMKWGAIRAHGKEILAWIDKSATQEVKPLPLPYDAFAHLRELQDDFRRLRHRLESAAKAVNLVPQLMGGRKAVYDLYLSRFEGHPSALERSWRHQLTGPLPDIDFTSLKNPTELIRAAMALRC